MTRINPIILATETLQCNQSELARRLGVERAVISVWKRRGHIPVRAVKHVAAVTGIPAYVLCPAYFPGPVFVTSQSAVAESQAQAAE